LVETCPRDKVPTREQALRVSQHQKSFVLRLRHALKDDGVDLSSGVHISSAPLLLHADLDDG